MVVVGPDGEQVYYSQYRGKRALHRFIMELVQWEQKILEIKRTTNVGIPTDVDTSQPAGTTDCFICRAPLNTEERTVIDHDHFTGVIRGWAHNSCNLRFQESKKIPVVFHNLRDYDGHIIMQLLGSLRRRITCIPKTLEKYITFKVGRLQFFDSFQFMPKSLGSTHTEPTEKRFPTSRRPFPRN